VSTAGPRPRITAALDLLDRPLTSYYLVLGTSGLLLAVGLVMVLSTSSASQLDAGSSPYSVFVKQLIGAAVGLAIIWVLARVPARLLRSVAYPLLLAAIAGLVLVLAFGTSAGGAERWIAVGPINVQPSEFAKFALLVWGADLLARREELGQLKNWRTLLIPLMPGTAVLAMLVMLGDDLGTTFVLLVILLTLLWVIGTPARIFACLLGLILFALVVLVIVQPYRIQRLTGYLNQSGNPVGANQQGIQGKWAIGSGGLFGVGLGNSKEKWGWVPNATNDFIFAILGEELGLIGTCCVVLLYGGLAFAGLRIARRMPDTFMRLAAAGATAWIVVQALVNICAVLGLLPITGVPLPLVSAGLSSLLATMTAIGMLLGFARCEPGARQALAMATPRWRRRLSFVSGRDAPPGSGVRSASGQKSSPPKSSPPKSSPPKSSPPESSPPESPARRVRRGREPGGSARPPRPERSRLTEPGARPARAGPARRMRLQGGGGVPSPQRWPQRARDPAQRPRPWHSWPHRSRPTTDT
jgi:cell division protein FtsW